MKKNILVTSVLAILGAVVSWNASAGSTGAAIGAEILDHNQICTGENERYSSKLGKCIWTGSLVETKNAIKTIKADRSTIKTDRKKIGNDIKTIGNDIKTSQSSD
jgi:hypothetical protein